MKNTAADHSHECRDCHGTIECNENPCRWDGGSAGCACFRTDEPRVGDFVQVTSGPAYVPGERPIKGRVEEVTPWEGADDAEVMVRVASGGLWGFNMSHLTKLEKR